MRIALISCSKKKADTECEAQEMYSKSALFKKTLYYCRHEKYDLIFILSAKYGVLKPEDKILPYELTLNSFSKANLKQWTEKCFKLLYDYKQMPCQFDFYAGKIYFEELSKLLPNSKNVLQGLGIGERLKFLSQ